MFISVDPQETGQCGGMRPEFGERRAKKKNAGSGVGVRVAGVWGRLFVLVDPPASIRMGVEGV